MMDIDRRSMLMGGAAATAAAAVGGLALPARAQAPQVGTQAPGYYRYRVGEFEVTVVTDGALTFPLPDQFVQNVDKPDVQQALGDAYRDTETVTVTFTPIVVNTGSRLVLIDTGYGEAIYIERDGRAGQLRNNLLAAGIDPATIDTVLISHLHADHINGLRMADGALAFPDAELLVPTHDWAFWMSEEEMNKLPEGYTKSVFPNVARVFAGIEDQVTHYDWDQEVVPGITSVATPGHTPGHTSFVIASGSDTVLVQSDVTNIPHLFLRNPTWQVMYDADPERAAETRRRGIAGPEVVERYPYLAGGRPERLPGIDELAALTEDAVIVSTADPFHHGIGYGDPPERALAPDGGGLELARATIEEGIALLGAGDYAGYDVHCVEAKSDARDAGVVFRYLRGELQGSILDLTYTDAAALYEAPDPTWVAAPLVEWRRVGRRRTGSGSTRRSP